MQTRVFQRLHRVMQAARAAEEVRLGALLARIEASRARAQALRRRLVQPPAGQAPDAADLTADARWRARLIEETRAEQARGAELAGQAQALRASLSRALGRESAAAELVEKARIEARREAMHRADLAVATRRPGGGAGATSDQSELSLPPVGAGSPGMA